jgi:hypothetical protein
VEVYMRRIQICAVFIVVAIILSSLTMAVGARSAPLIAPWVQLARLTAPGASGLGSSVAVSGNTVVAGSQLSAHVFVKPASGWADMTETAELTSSDKGQNIVVAMDGNTIVAGSLDHEEAYVYVKPKTGWKNMRQTAKLTPSEHSGYFGYSVAISGNTIVVGAPGSFEGTAAGSAYVFVKPASGWVNMTETAKLTASDETNSDQFGYSIAIGGGSVMVGAPTATIGSNIRQGAAYLFAKPDSGWTSATENAKAIASDGGAYTYLGWSVAVSSDTAVAGTNYGRSAYVYAKGHGGWASGSETAQLIGHSSWFATSVAAAGNKIVVGSPSFYGGAFVYVKPKTGWTTTSTYAAWLTSAKRGGGIGASVAVDDKTVVSGSPNHDQGQGTAYVFMTPTIKSFSPLSGQVGTPVRISGTSLAKTKKVTFGSVPATDFTADSDTQVTAVVPTGAVTGKITIKIPSGKVTSHNPFTVTP